jgi:hypothetical protein
MCVPTVSFDTRGWSTRRTSSRSNCVPSEDGLDDPLWRCRLLLLLLLDRDAFRRVSLWLREDRPG